MGGLGVSEDGLHQEPLPLLQRREHQQPKLSLQAERCGDGHLLYTYRQRITEEGGLFYRPALTEMSTGRGGVLICPSSLHRTAVGITESRWADSPNVLSSSLSFPYVLEKRLPRTFGNVIIPTIALIYNHAPGRTPYRLETK